MVSREAELVLKQLDILFVDDNISIAAEAHALFSTMFNTVILAHSVKSAKQHLIDKHIDLVITDIQLPDDDGLTLVEEIRNIDFEMPIIVISAHDDKEYLHRAANLRIDGFLFKPINFDKLNDLFERIANRLQHTIRNYEISEQVYFDLSRRLLIVDGHEVSLGQKEEMLLCLLINNKERIISRDLISVKVWPEGGMSDSALKNLLGALRKKLKYELILTVPVKGWLFKR